MKVSKVLFLAVGFICGLGCGAGAEPENEAPADAVTAQAGPVPTILERPFTAEQIREEWVEGFQLRIRRRTAETEVTERWTVVRADADGVDIESVAVDESGSPVAEATIQSSSWVQLRDHASFPADRASRVEVRRETSLGELDGWLYTVEDPEGGAVTEFFFARELPGAPVFVHVVRDGEIADVFEQLERSNR